MLHSILSLFITIFAGREMCPHSIYNIYIYLYIYDSFLYKLMCKQVSPFCFCLVSFVVLVVVVVGFAAQNRIL